MEERFIPAQRFSKREFILFLKMSAQIAGVLALSAGIPVTVTAMETTARYQTP